MTKDLDALDIGKGCSSRIAKLWAIEFFFALISFSTAAVQFFVEAGNVQNLLDLCTFCNILSRKMQIVQEFNKN